MKQFEYLLDENIREMYNTEKNKYTFLQFLNNLGSQGWEIERQITGAGNSNSVNIEYFAKREKIVPQQQSVNTGNHRVVAAPAGYTEQ